MYQLFQVEQLIVGMGVGGIMVPVPHEVLFYDNRQPKGIQYHSWSLLLCTNILVVEEHLGCIFLYKTASTIVELKNTDTCNLIVSFLKDFKIKIGWECTPKTDDKDRDMKIG